MYIYIYTHTLTASTPDAISEYASKVRSSPTRLLMISGWLGAASVFSCRDSVYMYVYVYIMYVCMYVCYFPAATVYICMCMCMSCMYVCPRVGRVSRRNKMAFAKIFTHIDTCTHARMHTHVKNDMITDSNAHIDTCMYTYLEQDNELRHGFFRHDRTNWFVLIVAVHTCLIQTRC